MKLKDKALEVIEALVSDDLSERMTYNVAMDRPFNLSNDDMRVLCNKINSIYKIAHAVRDNASCYYVHVDWRKELNNLYRKYKRANIL